MFSARCLEATTLDLKQRLARESLQLKWDIGTGLDGAAGSFGRFTD